jgi:hypothetical protein
VEAFNYAAYNLSIPSYTDLHVYDDNGDKSVNVYPIPSGGDGTLGGSSFLLFPYFCPSSDNQSLSGSVSATTKTVEAKTSITSTETLINSSDVTYVAGESISIQGGFQVELNSQFEIKILRTTCWD